MTKAQYIRIGILCAAVVTTWLVTASYKNAVWQERLTQEHNTQLQQHNEQLQFALEQERKARQQAIEIEVAYHDQTITVNTLAANNRRLADELGGLRDPYAASENTSTTASCAPCKPCDGKLSAEATRFLLELTEEADRLRAYADTCYKWVSRNEAH